MIINASVGDWKKRAKNDPKDIITVQSLLKQVSALAKQKAFDPKWIDGKIAKPPKESSTVKAILAFQATFMHSPDGLIEPRRSTIKKLNTTLTRSQFPNKPSFSYLSTTAKENLFGKFEYELPVNRDGHVIAGGQITKKGDWAKKNIITVQVPCLHKIPLFKANSNQFTSKMSLHKAIANQVRGIWQAWDHAGLIGRILTYDGAYNPRLARKSTTVLSSHAWGTAFDINDNYNRLGRIPAPLGDVGCVRELVQIANAFGFWWGGHWNRPDGMHFEAAIIGASPSPVA